MAFLKELPDPLRTMIELDAFTGLRRGELIGLRWQDVDFENLVLHIRRSVVAMVEGAPKTEASLKDVPLDVANGRISLGMGYAPRESESHDRRLHAGSRSAETRGTEQFGQIGKAGRRFGNQARLSGANWIMKENGDYAEPVYFVGVPDGI